MLVGDVTSEFGNVIPEESGSGDRLHIEKTLEDARRVADMPELAMSADDRTLLYASIAENTAVLIATLSDGSDPSALQPPPGASAYARELARRGVSLSVLLRAYRIGQARFTGMCLDVANDSAHGG